MFETSEAEVLRPARWYHLEGDARRGPIGLQDIRRLVLERVVGPQTLVWADGMSDWTPAARVPGICPPAPLRVRAAWPDPGDDA